MVGSWPEEERIRDAKHPGSYLTRLTWQRPAPVLWLSARYHAHLWVAQDAQDSVVRRVPVFEFLPEKTPCLGLTIAAAARGISPQQRNRMSTNRGFPQLGSCRIPLDKRGYLPIHYVGSRKCFEYETNRVVYQNVLQVYEPRDFRDKIVIIGETDYKAKDTFKTPFGEMPGMQVHANIVATLLNSGPHVTPVPQWQVTLVAFLCCILLIVPLIRWPLWSSLLMAAGEMVIVVLGAMWLFSYSRSIFYVSVPIIAVVLTYNLIGLYEYARTRVTLSRFIGREMVSQTMGALAPLKLGGRLETASAFFSDLRGYSELSERLPPETVTEMLNEYTGLVVAIARNHRGRPVDFLGDGVFILYEPSRAGKEYAVNAVEAALETQKRFVAYREKWHWRGAPFMQLGIAIHTGPMVIGIVGSEQHMKLGAIGDVVNVAARVQALSRECGYSVLITRETFIQVNHRVQATRCGTFTIRGRAQPVEVYGINSAETLLKNPQEVT